MDNPTGYLFRVGQNAARRLTRVGPEDFRPHLRMRFTILSLAYCQHSLRFKVNACASHWCTATGIRSSRSPVYSTSAHATVRTHLLRAMTNLRSALEVDHVD